MKKVTLVLTPKQAKIVRDDVLSTWDYIQEWLDSSNYQTMAEREESIESARDCLDIVKQLGPEEDGE